MRFKLGLVILTIWMFLLSDAGQAQTSGVAEGKPILQQPSSGVAEGKTILGQTSGGVAEGKSIPGDVTFQVPLNLTRLSSYVSKVAVTCKFGLNIDTIEGNRSLLTNRVEFPVSAGQVVTTASVVVAVPAYTEFKTGQSLNYECALTALSSEPETGGDWQPFDPKVKGDSLHVSPTPLPITGTFVW